jgi:hypothetical protein
MVTTTLKIAENMQIYGTAVTGTNSLLDGSVSQRVSMLGANHVTVDVTTSIQIGAASGVDITLQQSNDGSNWYKVGNTAFNQSTPGNYPFSNVTMAWVRVVFLVAKGTPPTIADGWRIDCSLSTTQA